MLKIILLKTIRSADRASACIYDADHFFLLSLVRQPLANPVMCARYKLKAVHDLFTSNPESLEEVCECVSRHKTVLGYEAQGEGHC
jgi:hypothetical protein